MAADGSAGLTNGLWIVGCSRYVPVVNGGALVPALLDGGVSVLVGGNCGVANGGGATDEPMVLQALPVDGLDGVFNTLRSATSMGVAESFQLGADGTLVGTVGHDGGGPTLLCADAAVVGAAVGVIHGFDDCDEVLVVVLSGWVDDVPLLPMG
ncbi:MAG TPA: hypothetical protein VHE81_23420 [Lacipirellulaceae bacterium]|nr:hypothetical protein [Lacipirellulaceae bacterium]